jgi:hypothetical protein
MLTAYRLDVLGYEEEPREPNGEIPNQLRRWLPAFGIEPSLVALLPAFALPRVAWLVRLGRAAAPALPSEIWLMVLAFVPIADVFAFARTAHKRE